MLNKAINKNNIPSPTITLKAKNTGNNGGLSSALKSFNPLTSPSKSLVSTTLKGCTIEKTEIFKDRVFVMVTYDAKKAKEDAKTIARELAKKEESLYNEFKARQAFDSLDQAIDRMKGSSSVAKPE